MSAVNDGRVLKAPTVSLVNDEGPVSDVVREALAEAFARGREQGRIEGGQLLAAQLQELITRLGDGVDAAVAAVAASVARDADEVVHLATDLAGWFLRDAVQADPQRLRSSLQAGLEAVADESDVVLYLHPDMVDALTEESHAIVARVRPDPALDVADFRLATDGTIVERSWQDAAESIGPELSQSLADPDAR